MKKDLLICIFLLNCFASNAMSSGIVRQIVSSGSYTEPNDKSVFTLNSYKNISYMPRLYMAGYAADNLVSQSDLLIPVHLAYDSAFVLYGQGRHSPDDNGYWKNETWTGSGGLLYRQIVADKSIFGAYILGDYSKTNSHEYWMISPGFENLGRKWDFRLNGYIPLDNGTLKNEIWAQELGDYSHIEFIEGSHHVYDHRFGYYEGIGIGGDAEIGRKLFKAGNTLVKSYIQGYYYSMKYNNDVTGVGAKITIQPSRYLTFSANDTYDNYQHNTFMLGAQIRLNDLFNKSNPPIDENDLAARLLDPIDRNFGSISSGSGVPITKGGLTDLGTRLYTANGVFFSNNGTGYKSLHAQDYPRGTYGNPYTEEDDIAPQGMQAILDKIHGEFPNQVYMYFSPGNYPASNGGSPIDFYNGMSAFGRNYWYTTPSTGDQRALFSGTINLLGNNTLDSIRIQDASPFISGITATDVSNIVLNNIEVGTQANIGNYATGITMNNSNILVSNSSIYGYQNGVAAADNQINATGIRMTNGGSLSVTNSNIRGTANETGGIHNLSGNGYGIHADGFGEAITINNSNIYGSGTFSGGAAGNFYASGNGYGLLIGANYSNSSANGDDFAVQNNFLTISNNSVIIGEGHNNLTLGTDQAALGNGFGVLIGHNYAIRICSGNFNTGDISIHNNELIIDRSQIDGRGTTNAIINSNIADSNGFAVLVGSNYSYLYAYNNDDKYINNSIHDNNITVSNSNLSGFGNIITGGITENYSGNGYGLLIGKNHVLTRTGHTDIERRNTIEFSSYNNVLNVDTSTINGYGSVDAIGVTNATLSGNGTGLLIGNGYFDSNANWVDNNVHGSTHHNLVNIINSDILGEGNFNFSGYEVGVGFGFIVGNELLYATNSIHYAGSIMDLSVKSNEVFITGGDVTAIGSSGANANSITIGYDFGHASLWAITDSSTSNNVLIVKNAVITAQQMVGVSGVSYGIKLADAAIYTPNSTDNELNINNSIFSITTNGTAGFGINMHVGAAVRPVEGTLNPDAATINIFSQSGVNIGISSAIVWADNTLTPW